MTVLHPFKNRYIEQNQIYLEMMRLFFRALNQGEFRVVTSIVTLLEVLVQPIRRGDTALAQQYRDILINESSIKRSLERR